MSRSPKTKSSAVVEIVSAGRSFGAATVLRNVDAEVRAGEVVGIIGPNGGGKTTLLLMMAGLLRPSVGSVSVCGVPADRLALESAGLVGLVMARPGLYPLLTGWENLDYFGGLFGLSASEVREKSRAMLEAFELGAQMDRRLATWSTGMQQKLSLVRALLLSPKLLLFDEPTANLDPLAARTLYEELRRRADDGLACVLVTHHLAAAESICDRVWLVNGSIREELVMQGPHELPRGPLLEAWTRMEAE